MIDSRTIEFKREYVDDIKYAVIAFANTDGGKLYIGMNDDGTPQGVMDIDQTLLRISNMIRDVIRPDVTMFVDYNVETIDDKQIIVVTI